MSTVKERTDRAMHVIGSRWLFPPPPLGPVFSAVKDRTDRAMRAIIESRPIKR